MGKRRRNKNYLHSLGKLMLAGLNESKCFVRQMKERRWFGLVWLQVMPQVKYTLDLEISNHLPTTLQKMLHQENPEEKDRQVQETQLFQAVYIVEEKSEIQVLKYLKDSCKVEEEVTENNGVGQEIISLRQTEHFCIVLSDI